MSVKNSVDVSELYKSAITADIHFAVFNKSGNKVQIPAHKAILMLRSTVFERMFYGDLKEEGPTVLIADVFAEAFEEFLQLFYIEAFHLTTENLPEIFKLIDKYDTASFWPVCERFLENTMTEDVAYLYYELVILYNLTASIASKLEDIICKEPKKAFKIIIDGGSNRDVLTKILQSDKLQCNEMDVFDGVISWATASLDNKGSEITSENIRSELGDCLTMVRFPTMSSVQFLNCIEKYLNLMSPEEYLDILRYITEKRTLTVASKYSIEPRLIPMDIKPPQPNTQSKSLPSLLPAPIIYYYKPRGG